MSVYVYVHTHTPSSSSSPPHHYKLTSPCVEWGVCPGTAVPRREDSRENQPKCYLPGLFLLLEGQLIAEKCGHRLQGGTDRPGQDAAARADIAVQLRGWIQLHWNRVNPCEAEDPRVWVCSQGASSMPSLTRNLTGRLVQSSPRRDRTAITSTDLCSEMTCFLNIASLSFTVNCRKVFPAYYGSPSWSAQHLYFLPKPCPCSNHVGPPLPGAIPTPSPGSGLARTENTHWATGVTGCRALPPSPPGYSCQGAPPQTYSRRSPCLRGRYCGSTRLTCSLPDTQWWKVMVKLSEGRITASGGSSTAHSLPCKTHLCVPPGAWLLERACIRTAGLLHCPDLTLIPVQVGMAVRPHLVKRSQALEPWASSGADQWQSILRMLLVRQVKVPAVGPGDMLHGRAELEGWGNLTADTLTGQSPVNDPRIYSGKHGEAWEVMSSECGYTGQLDSDTWLIKGPKVGR
ncbi:hypothetical protein P7K49_040733 [Saguinus oedipus]|uniref:Uncharacterized protein n=1 Tax=Saguinus oedipus TaxID=9490 RepID=A0ABQ9T9G7_SAGOE|nr:hypothetical protein P7K49_040733 [Saguinus oedipus]